MQVWRSNRPLLLQLPTPYCQITPSKWCCHIKVTKNDEFISTRNSGDDGIEVFIKLVLDLIWVGHGGCIGTDNGDKLLPIGKGESHHHEVIVHSFWGASQPANKC